MSLDTKVGAPLPDAHPLQNQSTSIVEHTCCDASDLALPGWADIYVSGEWAQRYEGDWREGVDLATVDRPTLYAAGQADGYRQAVEEFGALHWLLCYWLEVLP